MPKRKRENDESLEEEESASSLAKLDHNTKIRAAKLKAKTTQSIKSLHEALKFARGFERQKLGRRTKQAGAKKDLKALERLKEEVSALKALDLQKTALNHLLKQYVKAKRINEHPSFKAAYGQDVKFEGPKGPSEGNILARLFSSAPVKRVMPRVMAGALEVLGLEDFSHLQPPKEEGKALSKNPVDGEKGKAREGKPVRKVEAEFDGFSGDEDLEERLDEESIAGNLDDEHGSVETQNDDLDDMDLDQYNTRLASSESESDSEDEGGQDSESESRTTKIKPPSGPRRDLSITPSPSPSSSTSPSPPPQKPSTKSNKAASSPPAPTTKTTFLPSLMMGGYFSGSESGSDPAPGDAIPKPRKNRRGQRARQLIAERKHGKNAKHIAKAQKEGGKVVKWDPKRGAVFVDERAGGKKGWLGEKEDRFAKNGYDPGRGTRDDGRKGRGEPGKSAGSGANAVQVQVKRKAKAVSEGPLHPSWEAAKKRKEANEKGGIGKFEGKKITFD